MGRDEQAPDGAPGSRYDQIGKGYARHRRPDPRIAEVIDRALGDAHSVLDVGSGAGSYEPRRERVVAVEPSVTMIQQRPPGAAPVVRARAENLPFAGASFDAALAVLTIHHWCDAELGLAEMRRVARRQLVLTWDPTVWSRFWLVADYLPGIVTAETEVATLARACTALAVTEVLPVPVPWDCTDGFCGAYWRRPHDYLDADVRAAISGLARCEPAALSRGLRQLAGDLADGTWERRNASLMELTEVDLGYRLVVASTVS